MILQTFFGTGNMIAKEVIYRLLRSDFQGFLDCLNKINPNFVIVKNDNLKTMI